MALVMTAREKYEVTMSACVGQPATTWEETNFGHFQNYLAARSTDATNLHQIVMEWFSMMPMAQ